MRYTLLFLSTLLTFTVQAQVILPSYQGTLYHKITVVIPTVTTTAMSSITAGTASSGGNVTSAGGGTVTAKGVCWNTSTGPTIANNITTNGTGTGSYTSALTLTPGTTYYLRAYATNSAGTAYGAEVSFTTLTVAVGDNFGGGYVAYLLLNGQTGYDATSQHGLIVAASDLTAATWNAGTGNGVVTSSNVGDGNANTIAIVAAIGAGTYAASECANLVLNGYSDWYLPSYSDLQQIGFNSSTLGASAGFTPFSGMYWTSFNNGSSSTAYEIVFPSQIPNFKPQGSTLNVRAIRSF